MRDPTVRRPVYPVVGKVRPQRRQQPGLHPVPGEVPDAVVLVDVGVGEHHEGADEHAGMEEEDWRIITINNNNNNNSGERTSQLLSLGGLGIHLPKKAEQFLRSSLRV